MQYNYKSKDKKISIETRQNCYENDKSRTPIKHLYLIITQN